MSGSPLAKFVLIESGNLPVNGMCPVSPPNSSSPEMSRARQLGVVKKTHIPHKAGIF